MKFIGHSSKLQIINSFTDAVYIEQHVELSATLFGWDDDNWHDNRNHQNASRHYSNETQVNEKTVPGVQFEFFEKINFIKRRFRMGPVICHIHGIQLHVTTSPRLAEAIDKNETISSPC